jgi:hypothetical protein
MKIKSLMKVKDVRKVQIRGVNNDEKEDGLD